MIRTVSLSLIILSFFVFFAGRALTQGPSPEKDESAPAESRTPGEVIVLEINGTINPATLDYIRTGLETAGAGSAEALVILLDTPGGLLTSTKEIVKLILNSPVPVVVYVSPRGASATSAGVFITLSANIAAMAPGTSIGAAHPVSLGPGGGEEKKESPGEKPAEGDKKPGGEKEPSSGDKSNEGIMGEKLENYASSFIESIAEERGRNVEWAEEAVRKSDSITSSEALEMKVIDLIALDLPALLASINGWKVEVSGGERTLLTKDVPVRDVGMTAKQKFIDIISTPDIAFLLLSLGSLGLLLEFYNPGLIFPGVAGVVCLLMGFVSFQVLPFNYAGIALLVLGIALFIAEVYVTGYGLLAVGGLVSFALGALLLFDTPESDVRVGFDVVVASTLAFGIFFAYVIFYLIKAQRLAPRLGMEGLMGEAGDAVSDIHASGKVYINGEYWDAVSDEPIAKGERVRVEEALEGFRLKVRKA
ncbi:MAG TPA: nodulation protein NfeD [Thermodesulfobacteriota bacterium]|nr:nodulation protein NfeD [Thermodesulfobacteriota bacterium]